VSHFRFLEFVALVWLLAAAPVAQQTQPQVSGSSRLSGRVVADDDGGPVRRTTVRLSGVPESQLNAGPNRVSITRSVETDVNGRFDFSELPGGSYIIRIDSATGFVRPRSHVEATLFERQTRELTLRLERTGAIEGRIQDENGDAMLGTRVQAVRRLNIGGYTTLTTPGGSTTTNDLGEFRLFNLPPGEYYVVATHMPSRALHDSAPVSSSGYADTYYPGSPALRDARVVVVRGGRDSSRVNFALAPSRLARLTINPIDSRGVPLGRGAQLSLTKLDPVYLHSSSRQMSRRDDGTFVFDGVQPGHYYLVVTTSAQMEEAAYVNVSIRETDVSLSVQTNTGARVSGRIIVEGQPAAGRGSPLRDVYVSARTPPGKYGPMYARGALARVQEIDRFELNGLRGPMVLHADIGSGALLSIRRGEEEIAGKMLEFTGTETLDDVVVAVTTQVAQVEVIVTDTNSRGETNPVLLVLFPEDPTQSRLGVFGRYARTTTSPESAGARVSRSPATQLIRVPAGRYLLAAVPDIDVNFPAEAAILEQLRPLARPVTLVAGQTAKITLGVARMAR
jgi:hypothetical protein